MPRRAAKDDTDEPDDSVLPTCTGSLMDIKHWLRELDMIRDLLPPEVAYFLSTAAAILSNGKTAFFSVKQALLLRAGFISAQRYGILNLVPTDDFAALYDEVRTGIAAGNLVARGGIILPEEPDESNLTDMQVIAPDKLMLIDTKLKGILLRLFTSPGRMKHYMLAVGQSGIELLYKLKQDSKLADTRFTQNPHTRMLKVQMAEIMKMRLTRTSIDEFNKILDLLEDINTQLEDHEGKLSELQRSEHYITLIRHLKSDSLMMSLEMELRLHQVVHGDLEGTKNAITRVLTHRVMDLECDRIEAQSNRALVTKPAGSKDPRKTNLNKRGPPTTPCPICGSMKHWSIKCYQNPNADDDTKRRAPKESPAGKAWAQRQGKDAPAPAAGTDSRDKTCTEGKALTCDEEEDPLMRALDSAEGDSLIVGRAAIVYENVVEVDCELCSDEEPEEARVKPKPLPEFEPVSSRTRSKARARHDPPPYDLPPPMRDIKLNRFYMNMAASAFSPPVVYASDLPELPSTPTPEEPMAYASDLPEPSTLTPEELGMKIEDVYEPDKFFDAKYDIEADSPPRSPYTPDYSDYSEDSEHETYDCTPAVPPAPPPSPATAAEPPAKKRKAKHTKLTSGSPARSSSCTLFTMAPFALIAIACIAPLNIAFEGTAGTAHPAVSLLWNGIWRVLQQSAAYGQGIFVAHSNLCLMIHDRLALYAILHGVLDITVYLMRAAHKLLCLFHRRRSPQASPRLSSKDSHPRRHHFVRHLHHLTNYVASTRGLARTSAVVALLMPHILLHALFLCPMADAIGLRDMAAGSPAEHLALTVSFPHTKQAQLTRAAMGLSCGMPTLFAGLAAATATVAKSRSLFQVPLASIIMLALASTFSAHYARDPFRLASQDMMPNITAQSDPLSQVITQTRLASLEPTCFAYSRSHKLDQYSVMARLCSLPTCLASSRSHKLVQYSVMALSLIHI